MSLEDIEQAGFDHIADVRQAIRQLWVKMCEHDGIDPNASFVLFSDDNPYTPFYNNAMKELQEAKAAHVPGGGYVGLRIDKGRAVVPKRQRNQK